MTTLDEFKILSKLGEGSYSCVYLVERIVDGDKYALKRVKINNLSPKEKENALNEVRILASIKNPHIIGYKEAFFDESTDSLCIVMEYAQMGDLYKKINNCKKDGTFIGEEALWSMFIQMVMGL